MASVLCDETQQTTQSQNLPYFSFKMVQNLPHVIKMTWQIIVLLVTINIRFILPSPHVLASIRTISYPPSSSHCKDSLLIHWPLSLLALSLYRSSGFVSVISHVQYIRRHPSITLTSDRTLTVALTASE